MVLHALYQKNRVLHKLIINRYTKYKKQYQKDQLTIQSFDKIFEKSLQDNPIKKKDMIV